MVYAAFEVGQGGDCDRTATSREVTPRLTGGFRGDYLAGRRLEFAAFSVKSRPHDIRG